MNECDKNEAAHDSEIAIIGMSGRFPGAGHVDAFWQNLRDGSESISFLSDEELAESGIAPARLKDPTYVRAQAVLEDIELFDASFFGFSPREAEMMDPQPRIFLECAWEALESAGYDPETCRGSIGCFAGEGMNMYMLHNLYPNVDLSESATFYQATINNDKDALTTLVAYKLNLQGPSVTIQTACSTSLVAVHIACQSLLNGECDMVLAGGITINVPQKTGYLYQDGMILSPDGHCRAFDADAKGMVGGSGVGIVVLKRLEDALADGDCIHAVIRGSAINNDGSKKVDYTAPSVDGQAEVIAEAQAVAGISPETITYIEAHGTGTALGDPIEIAGLTKAFRAGTGKKGFCAIGSVKTNIGHLDTAAGIAGLIKTVLALKHRQIPPSLHFKRPNPEIDFANSPFYVNTILRTWETGGIPRRAGVSSFGIGGTNAHVVLEEAPEGAPSEVSSRPYQLLPISAKTESALDKVTANLAAHFKKVSVCPHSLILPLQGGENAATCSSLVSPPLEGGVRGGGAERLLKKHPETVLADAAFTLSCGRRDFSHRRVLICGDLQEAASALESLDPQRVFTADREPKNRSVAFMFSGQGAQYVNMGLELYRVEGTFREQVDICSEILKPLLGFDLGGVLYPDGKGENDAEGRLSNSSPPHLNPPPPGGRKLKKRPKASPFPPGGGRSGWGGEPSRLTQTSVAQPALFVLEYALARLWMAWGIRPEAMVGHSIGEYVAATLAGVFSLEDALGLVAARGRMMQQLPGGAMLAVSLSEKEVEPLLGKELYLAAVNGPSLTVVSGKEETVSELRNRLTEEGVVCRPLHTSHAFHSGMMAPIVEAFRDQVKGVDLAPPRIPYVSNLTGTWITGEEATDPGYWSRHLRETVRFFDGLKPLFEDPGRVLLEVGPGSTLSSLAMGHPDRGDDQVILQSVRHPRDHRSDTAFLFTTLGRLWLSGVEVDWPGFYAHEGRHRLPLPTYPFERRRYWVDSKKEAGGDKTVVLRKKPDLSDWFYVPSWQRSLLPEGRGEEENPSRSPWLIFMDECGLGPRLAAKLSEEGRDVIAVRQGPGFARMGDKSYEINPTVRKDYDDLFDELRLQDRVPQNIVHLWSVTRENHGESDCLKEHQEGGFYSLLFLGQVLGRQYGENRFYLKVVSNHLQEVTGEEVLHPGKAPLLGPVKVIGQEYPNISCQSIDIAVSDLESRNSREIQDRLLVEFTTRSSDPMIAYRGKYRWVQTFIPVRLPLDEKDQTGIREKGVYLITGGLGGVGLLFAEYLAKKARARLILTGRSALPPRHEWEQRLADHAENDDIRLKIHKILALEALGADVIVLSADAADQQQMQKAVIQAKERFGTIHGVIHAAGITGGASFCAIEEMTADDCRQQFQPKIQGTMVLERVLEGTDLDFCILMSSLSSVLGGLQFVSYAAANLFMDAFASWHNRGNNVPWISVNWDGWQLDHQNSDPSTATSAGSTIAELTLTPEEGMAAFQSILSLNGKTNQIIVSTSDLQKRIEQWIRISPQDIPERSAKSALPSSHARPNLSNSYLEPRTDIEREITHIWEKLLGLNPVGIQDNFFDLGGHSLLGTQVISRLRQTFQVEINIRNLFDNPTVAELAERIEKIRFANRTRRSEMPEEREELVL